MITMAPASPAQPPPIALPATLISREPPLARTSPALNSADVPPIAMVRLLPAVTAISL